MFYEPKVSIDVREDNTTTIPYTPLLLAACIPDGCMPSEIFDLGLDTYCETKNEYRQLDAGDISCM